MREHIELELAPGRSIWEALLKAADDPRLERLAFETNRMITRTRTSTPSAALQPSFILDWKNFSEAIDAEKQLRKSRHLLSLPATRPLATHTRAASSPGIQSESRSSNTVWTLTATPSKSKGRLDVATFTAERNKVTHRVSLEDNGLWLQHFRNLVPVTTADKLFAALKRGQVITFPGSYTSGQLRIFHFFDLT